MSAFSLNGDHRAPTTQIPGSAQARSAHDIFPGYFRIARWLAVVGDLEVGALPATLARVSRQQANAPVLTLAEGLCYLERLPEGRKKVARQLGLAYTKCDFELSLHHPAHIHDWLADHREIELQLIPSNFHRKPKKATWCQYAREIRDAGVSSEHLMAFYKRRGS